MQNVPVKPEGDARFRFKFTPFMFVLSAAGLFLCAVCIAYTSWQIALFVKAGDLSSVYSWMKFGLLYLVAILLAVLLIAMLIRSQYVVTDKALIMQFGFIKQKFDLKTIYSVHLFKGAGRLAVYFDDFKTNYVIIVVKEAWYNEFIRELTSRNERIAFSFSTAEEEEEVKKGPRKK